MPKHAGFHERKYRLAETEMRRCDPTSSERPNRGTPYSIRDHKK